MQKTFVSRQKDAGCPIPDLCAQRKNSLKGGGALPMLKAPSPGWWTCGKKKLTGSVFSSLLTAILK